MNKSEVYFILLYIVIRDPQIALKNHCEARSLETLAFVSKLRLMEPTRAERKNPWKKHMKVVGRTEIYQTRKHNDLRHETESPVLSWCPVGFPVECDFLGDPHTIDELGTLQESNMAMEYHF